MYHWAVSVTGLYRLAIRLLSNISNINGCLRNTKVEAFYFQFVKNVLISLREDYND